MAIFHNPDRSDVVEHTHRHKVITVGTTAVIARAADPALTDRQIIYLYNHGPGTVRWGASNVTTTGADEGVILAFGQFASLPFGNLPLYLISSVASTRVTVGEVG